jgi:phage baseplate assembly protein W
MNIAFPYRIDLRSRTAESGDDDHVREMMEQLLFTNPGERVNRPAFGTGLRQLVFAPNSPELAASTQLLIQGALQQWLGALIEVSAVEVQSSDATLTIAIRYMVRRTQQIHVAQFTRGQP